MNDLTNADMYKVKGGAIKWGVFAGIGAFASFIAGVVDGFINPKKCNG